MPGRCLTQRLAGAQPAAAAAAAVLEAYGTTGVLEALRRATRLRAATLAFPVGNVETCVGVDVGGGDDNASLVLPDCVMLKPGATVQVCIRDVKKSTVARTAFDLAVLRGENPGFDQRQRSEFPR